MQETWLHPASPSSLGYFSNLDDIAGSVFGIQVNPDLTQQTDHGNSFVYFNMNSWHTLGEPSTPTLHQNTRKELKLLLLQLNPMLGMAPNISLETSVIKLLLESHSSQAARDGLSGSGTHLKPTTSSSPTDSHQQHSSSHCPHLGTWPWENVGKASSVFLLPWTSSPITTAGDKLPFLIDNLSRTGTLTRFLLILQTSLCTIPPTQC